MHRELYAIDGQGADRRSLHGRIGVTLAEDHPRLRRTLRRLIDAEQDMMVISEATEPAGLLRQLRRDHPKVLVLDGGMGGGSCLEEIRRLRSLESDTQIVLMTMQDSRALADATISAGAIGFVLKDTADQELCEAVRCAARNITYLSPRVTER